MRPATTTSTRPHFSDNPTSSTPGRTAWRSGCRIHPNLVWRSFDAIFDKGEYAAAYSGFEGADHSQGDIGLEAFLRDRGVTEVDVCGIATDYCVNATAVDAVHAGFDTSVLLELTAAVAPPNVPGYVQNWQTEGIWVATASDPEPGEATAP